MKESWTGIDKSEDERKRESEGTRKKLELMKG
jgi:hypothetical protein